MLVHKCVVQLLKKLAQRLVAGGRRRGLGVGGGRRRRLGHAHVARGRPLVLDLRTHKDLGWEC